MPGIHYDRFGRFTPDMKNDPAIVIDHYSKAYKLIRWHYRGSSVRMYDDEFDEEEEDEQEKERRKEREKKQRKQKQAKTQKRDKKGRFQKGYKQGPKAAKRYDRQTGKLVDKQGNLHDKSGRFAGKQGGSVKAPKSHKVTSAGNNFVDKQGNIHDSKGRFAGKVK